MRIAQVGDEAKINELLNDPDIRPFIFPGDQPLDCTGLIGDSIFLFDEHGVFMADALGDGEFLVMSAFRKDSRGLRSVISHRKALDILFFHIGALRVFATIDQNNVVAIRNVSGLGFQVERHGLRFIASIDYMSWAQKTKTFEDDGYKVAREKGKQTLESLARALGAFVASVRSGWVGLALKQYNKYAQLHGLMLMTPAHETENWFNYCGRLLKIEHNDIDVGR